MNITLIKLRTEQCNDSDAPPYILINMLVALKAKTEQEHPSQESNSVYTLLFTGKTS